LNFRQIYIYSDTSEDLYGNIMAMISELLTPSEAAVVSSVTVRDVNRVIDESILPAEFIKVGDGRHVRAAGCSLIAFYFESAKQLTSEQRLWAIKSAGARLRKPATAAALLKEDWIFRDDFLTIDLAPFLRKTWERLGRLEEARALVVTSPEVLGGATPVIRGTRIPVYDVAASVAAGLPVSRILTAYPSLDADKVELAAIYAEANPPRGRPRQSPELPKGATVITDRRVSRRRKAE
jgi:uncharacterized protein (DUF433 family)